MGKKKLNYEDVKEYIESLGYKLINKEYHGTKHKLILKDNEGYFYMINITSLRNIKKICKFSKSNLYSIKNIKLFLLLNGNNIKLISKKYKGTNKKLKFKCLKEKCGEEFETNLDVILSNSGCPYCAGVKVGISNCLATKRPDLIEEWHPTKNGDLTPWDVTYGSGKHIWWKCNKNPKHEWSIAINLRTSHNCNCPYCSGRYPSEDYNLLVCNPKLASEWSYSKNKKRPEDYTPGSNKYAWWKCSESNCGHEWYAQINTRNNNNSWMSRM